MFLLIFISCDKDRNEIIEYNERGEIISISYIAKDKNSVDSIIYYKNKKISVEVYPNRKNKFSSFIKYFDKNGVELSEGNTFKKNKIGRWKYYNSRNKISKIVEYITICDSEYPNQEYNLNNDGTIIINKSNYFTYKIKYPCFKLNECNIITISYYPLYKTKSKKILIFSPEFDDNFCNVEKVPKDSISMATDHVFKVPFGSAIKGKFFFKAIIKEYYYESNTENRNIGSYVEKRTYIKIPFIVK